MKRIITLIIVTILVMLELTACSNTDTNSSKAGINNLFGSSKTDMNNVSHATEFSNGYAFIQYEDSENQYKTYCIDKNGKEIFNIENANIANFAKFNKKIAIVETLNFDEYVFCDKKGNITKAEDYGATRIVLDTDDHQKAFLDGYIILERKEETYSGTKTEMSIINSDFETLAPFSSDLAETIDSLQTNGTKYFNGYIFFNDVFLDLRNGRKITDKSQLITENENKKFYYDTRRSKICDFLTDKTVANLEDRKTVSDINFVDNTGLVKYCTDNGYWFNICTEKGEAKFEPKKAETESLAFDGQTIVDSSICEIKKEDENINAAKLITYDVNGNKLAENVFEIKSSTPYYGITLSDGVIRLNVGGRYYYLNNSLEEIF